MKTFLQALFGTRQLASDKGLIQSSRIKNLASTIVTNTTKFDECLKSHDLSPPSFAGLTDNKWPQSKEFQEAQTAILEATSELQALVMEPTAVLRNLALRYIDLISLQAIYKFKIAQSFSEQATYEEISRECDLDEPTLRRLMRHAMTNYVFKEQDGLVTHTPASKLLHEDPFMRAWVGMICEESWPAAARTVDALKRWPGSQEPEHTGFALANNTARAFFEELGKDPVRGKRFADAMSTFEAAHGPAFAALIDHYPWDTVGEGTVIDVGGSHGDRSKALASKFPNIHCIVLDLPEVVADGSSHIPPELQSRVTFVAHDFFKDPPDIVKGAEIFLFSRVFHNWSDKFSCKILRCLRPALKKGARILINDTCLKEPNVLPRTVEKKMRSLDLGMMAMVNARERGQDDWAALFQEADEGFHFLGVRTPPGSNLAFIEASWEGHDGS